MTRGTTPDYTLTINGIEDLSQASLYVTLKQNDVMITKETKDVTIDKNVIQFDLTQEETLEFKSGTAKMQVRGVLDGVAFATQIVQVAVNPILRGGVIT